MATLDNLPLDLHFQILSFLLRPTALTPTDHPFLALSATSRSLHSAVTAYTTHTLHALASRPLPPPSTTSKTPLKTLLTFLTKNCAFCHNPTVSHARLHPTLPCCRTCDLIHYPNKITLSNAMKTYNLTKPALRANVPFGQYMCSNILTTVFLGADVEAFATKTHGPLDIFLAKKAQRKRKREENMEARALHRKRELAALLHVEGM